jgi:hypothetical protein
MNDYCPHPHISDLFGERWEGFGWKRENVSLPDPWTLDFLPYPFLTDENIPSLVRYPSFRSN